MERSVLPLSCGLYPLSCELQVVVIARLRNFNMVNILCISSSFNIVTYFTTFYRRTKIHKTHGSVGNSFVFARGLVTYNSYHFLLRRLERKVFVTVSPQLRLTLVFESRE